MSFVLSEESEAEYRVSTVRTGRGVLYESTLDCLLKTAKSEGPLTVFRGFSMQWLRLGPHTTISLMCFEQLRHLETWTQFCFTFCDTFVLSQFVPFMFFPVVFLFVCPKGCLTFFYLLSVIVSHIYIYYIIYYIILYIYTDTFFSKGSKKSFSVYSTLSDQAQLLSAASATFGCRLA